MTLDFNTSLAEGYKSPSQIARVLTEDWFKRNMYCPSCGRKNLTQTEANSKVEDFYCDDCLAQYELKSRKKKTKGIGRTILGSEYYTMMKRIHDADKPDFFLLTYDNNQVRNLVLIPKEFFVPGIVIKRKPLNADAKRAGWTGCLIDLTSIPEDGKIWIIRDSVETDHRIVLDSYRKIKSLPLTTMGSRKWLVDILQCVDKLGAEFTLNDMYAFTETLQSQHPRNKNIQAKIRQQLQILRKKGLLIFTKRGHYKKATI